MNNTVGKRLIEIAGTLNNTVKKMTFAAPVAYVYNPLDYARRSHTLYLETYGNGEKKTVFLGMNPGPWGMAQTGIPFGEIDAAKHWLKMEQPVDKPEREHPKRRIEGFNCTRSEVSGRRLWGLFKERFPNPHDFFKHHFVGNYCPLVFMEESGRNRTPDKLKKGEKEALFAVCDLHLRQLVEILEPDWVIGVGAFARLRAEQALSGLDVHVGGILHPSPASPAANRDWAGQATAQFSALGISL